MARRRIGGRYRLLEARARGGMAAVWRGRDERTGEAVAVKVLHPHLGDDEEARERLQREATAMRSVDHPNVVAVRDVLVDDDGAAMVMDFVDGRSLAERIGEGPLPEPEALRIATEVADGLAEAHAHGIVHRDVKPANILLDADGAAWLTDFGIAASLEAAADEQALTREHGVVGTLRYLSPERLLGESATPATDVWGLGAVLYEMLAGEPAFPASTVLERTDPDRERPSRPAAAGDATWAVIERAMAGDPARRYPDGRTLASALRGAMAATARGGPDPSGETVVIPVPLAPQAAATTPAPTSAVLPATGGRRGSSDRPIAPVLAGLALAAAATVAVLAIGLGGRSDTDRVVPTAAPATTVGATAAPPTASPAPAEDADAGKPAKDEKPGKGKGNGNGRGKNHGG